jgi:integrase/recombinase XerD
LPPRNGGEDPDMPIKLSTTVSKIGRVPNRTNAKIILDFHKYMQARGSSEHHQNNNLKAIIAFAMFLGSDTAFYQIKSKDQITAFLDTKIMSPQEDPEKRWITTWNDNLARIKLFLRWLYNKPEDDGDAEGCDPKADWETPAFAKIKQKKTKRLSPSVIIIIVWFPTFQHIIEPLGKFPLVLDPTPFDTLNKPHLFCHQQVIVVFD